MILLRIPQLFCQPIQPHLLHPGNGLSVLASFGLPSPVLVAITADQPLGRASEAWGASRTLHLRLVAAITGRAKLLLMLWIGAGASVGANIKQRCHYE